MPNNQFLFLETFELKWRFSTSKIDLSPPPHTHTHPATPAWLCDSSLWSFVHVSSCLLSYSCVKWNLSSNIITLEKRELVLFFILLCGMQKASVIVLLCASVISYVEFVLSLFWFLISPSFGA